MSASSTTSGTNPFAAATAVAITTATAQLINIKSHVPVTLDLGDSNFGTWRTFFLIAFRKFGVLDHTDGTRFSDLMLDYAEWTQIDTCIVSWLYTTLSSDLLSAVIQPADDAYTTWTAITDQFLDNVVYRTVQARQEFHGLHQGDMTITEYCGRLKVLTDTLRDVGAPVSDPDLVVSLLSGLNDKFANCVTTISAARPRMTFRQARSFLLQEEIWMNTLAQKAAATALLSSTRSTGASPATPAAGSAPHPSPPVPQAGGQHSGGNDNRARKRKKQDGRHRNNQGGPTTGGQPRGAPTAASWDNPWHGVVQAWPLAGLPQVQPAAGLLGARPGVQPQQSMAALHQPAGQLPPALYQALTGLSLQSTPPSATDWVFDTGASSHMASSSGILSSTAPSTSRIIVGNGASLPVQCAGTAAISPSLTLHDVLVSPSLIHNLVSVRWLTRDNSVSVEFDPFGFSIKDLHSRTTLL